MSPLGPALRLFVLLAISAPAGAEAPARRSPDGLWTLLEAAPVERAGERPWVRPAVGQVARLDAGAMRASLDRVAMEFTPEAIRAPSILTLPRPDGGFSSFVIVESPVMAPELWAAFPEIRTYAGQGIDDPSATVRLDFTVQGFHAQVLSPSGAYYIDPWTFGDLEHYAVYSKREYVKANDGWSCLVPDAPGDAGIPESGYGRDGSDSGERAAVTLRTYRTAVAATGEYTSYHGGTVTAGMSAVVTAVNRVTGVYENDLAIRLALVANNNVIIYTNAATDPYTNSSGSAMLGQNQTNLDSVILTANYDIGHVFSTGGGGVANLGVVCVAGNKARGVTGSASPVGDAFWIDYVAHEMGHQFNANHTFNSTTSNCGGGNRSSSHAYEPGSGSTIMSYAGICGTDDLQAHSDPYFHHDSLDSILTFTRGGGAGTGCPATSATGNNDPSVSATSGYVIPVSTPFALTASASDPDNDQVTYCWEQRNLGPAQTLNAGDNGSSPLFRSFMPTTSPTRLFPTLNGILNGANAAPGETLPTTNRTMVFRCTVRDNRIGGGGLGSVNITVTSVPNAGPFRVTSPNTGGSFVAGPLTVTWDVAGTNTGAVNCANVSILLSTDGGTTFPTVLAGVTPNDGSEEVTLPAVNTTNARIKIEAVGNIFFDISNANFTITPVAPPGPFNLLSPAPGATNVLLPVTLSWSTSSGATGYQVQIDTESLFLFPVLHTAATGSTSYAVPGGVLSANATYYWRVIASNGTTTIGTPASSPFTTSSPPPCPGDLNNDGFINTVDLTLLLANFGQSVLPNTGGDINGDGFVNTVDLTLLLANFGHAC